MNNPIERESRERESEKSPRNEINRQQSKVDGAADRLFFDSTSIYYPSSALVCTVSRVYVSPEHGTAHEQCVSSPPGTLRLFAPGAERGWLPKKGTDRENAPLRKPFIPGKATCASWQTTRKVPWNAMREKEATAAAAAAVDGSDTDAEHQQQSALILTGSSLCRGRQFA